jgi:hypothetical protein
VGGQFLDRDSNDDCLIILSSIHNIIVGETDAILVVSSHLTGAGTVIVDINTAGTEDASAAGLCHVSRVDNQVNWVPLKIL